MIEVPLGFFKCSVHSVETQTQFQKINFFAFSEIHTAVEQRQKGRILVYVLFLCIERTIRREWGNLIISYIWYRSLQHWDLLWEIYFYFLARHLLYFKEKGVNQYLKAYWNSRSSEKFQAQNMTLVNPPNFIPKFIFPHFSYLKISNKSQYLVSWILGRNIMLVTQG